MPINVKLQKELDTYNHLEKKLNSKGSFSKKDHSKLNGIQQRIERMSSDLSSEDDKGVCSELQKKCSDLTLQAYTKSPAKIEKGHLLQRKISLQVFPMFNNKEKKEKNQQKLDSLKKEYKELADKINKGLEELSTNKSDKKCQKIQTSLAKRGKIVNQIEKLENKVSENNKNDVIGNHTRNCFVAIGGENVKFKAKDGKALLNGTFLDAQEFRQKLKDAGGQQIKYSRTLPTGETKVMQGIVFPKASSSPKDLFFILSQLHAFTCYQNSKKENGAGWIIVRDGDDLVLTTDQQAEAILNNESTSKSLVEFNYETQEFVICSDPKLKRETSDLETQSSGGSIIITSGMLGVYEMHKQEGIYFLLKGMNVFLFNFRGHGESEGVPTEKGLDTDYDSAFEYVQARTGCREDQILIKALCMSGGAASVTAKKHPKSHIILDQSFANFKDLTKNQIKEECRKSNSKIIKKLTPLASFLGTQAIPGWNPTEALKHNEGNKLIFYATEDEVIPKEHINAFSSALKDQKKGTTTFYGLAGTHGENWLDEQDPVLNDHERIINDIEVAKIKKRMYEKQGQTLKAEIEELEILKLEKELKKQLEACKARPTARKHIDAFIKQNNLSDEIIA